MLVGRHALVAVALAAGCAAQGAAQPPQTERPASPVDAASEPPAVVETPPEDAEIPRADGEALLDAALIGGIEILDAREEGEGEGARLDIERGGDLGEPEPQLPTVELVEIEVEGPARASARRAVELRLTTVARCVDAHGPAEDSALTLTLDIDADGSVAGVESSDALGPDHPLSRCVARAARRWRFRSGAPGTVAVAVRVSPPPPDD